MIRTVAQDNFICATKCTSNATFLGRLFQYFVLHLFQNRDHYKYFETNVLLVLPDIVAGRFTDSNKAFHRYKLNCLLIETSNNRRWLFVPPETLSPSIAFNLHKCSKMGE